jgi:ubiquinone/menaquinone biosynthesis C-methylase UbiE
MFGHPHPAATADASTRGSLIRWARFYDPLTTLVTFGRAPAMRAQAAELAAIQPGEAVLDVGCGTGELTRRVVGRVGPTGTVAGIDPSAAMIDVARSKAARTGRRIDYRVAPIEALPFANATFDVVLSSLMMHHLPEDLKPLGLVEVRRVLKPSGRLVIVDMKRPSGWLARLTLAGLIHHASAHGIQDLPAVLVAVGFVDVMSGETRFGSLGFVSARVSHAN